VEALQGGSAAAALVTVTEETRKGKQMRKIKMRHGRVGGNKISYARLDGSVRGSGRKEDFDLQEFVACSMQSPIKPANTSR
jgi:hypothetical protein